jgi:hypothetical protein
VRIIPRLLVTGVAASFIVALVAGTASAGTTGPGALAAGASAATAASAAPPTAPATTASPGASPNLYLPEPSDCGPDDVGTLTTTRSPNGGVYVFECKDLGGGQYGWVVVLYVPPPPPVCSNSAPNATAAESVSLLSSAAASPACS